MKRYEYTAHGFHAREDVGMFERLNTELNVRAKQGWRLVTMFRDERTNLVGCVFERELEEEEE